MKGLGLEKVGVELNAKGAVMVDHKLHTIQPHIYAMGDVTDRINLTPVARRRATPWPIRCSADNPREFRCRTSPRRCSPRRRSPRWA